MISCDENALICDLAETYNIYNYRSLPVDLVATFCCGLRDDSRIKMKLSGVNIPLDTQLNALMVDALSLLLWTKSKDAVTGRNRPKSIYQTLIDNSVKKDSEFISFESVEDFNEQLERIRKEGTTCKI